MVITHPMVKGGSTLADEQSVSYPNDRDQWQVGLLRATTFIPNLTTDDAIKNTWWGKIIGSKMDEENIDRQNGVKEQKGFFHGNHLVMVSQSGRVDLILAATEERSSETSELPALGPMSPDTLSPFAEIVKNWLNKSPPVNRLAFGANLGMRTTDAQTGYKKIQPYLPNVKLNPESISNFRYQINRPKESTVSPGTMINRLNIWTVVLLSTVEVTVEPTASKASANIKKPQYVCRLDLDINTSTLDDEVKKNGANSIFQELVEHGQEIASKGDVA